MIDDSLSRGVLTYVGFDGDSAIPGRHLERIENVDVRNRVRALIAEIDEMPVGDEAQDLFVWAEERRRTIAAAHPEISDEALHALKALMSFEWR